MHEQFDEIIGTPPQSAIDTYAVARRVRRTRGARRAVIAATTLVAVGLTGGLLISNDPPVGRSPGPTDVAAPNDRAVAPADNRIELKADTRSNGEASADQLTALVEEAVKEVAPDAVWTSALDVEFHPDGHQWSGHGGLQVGAKTGNITVWVVRGRNAGLDGAMCPSPPMKGCTDGTSPGGRRMMTFDGGEGSSRLIRAAIELPGFGFIAVHHIPDASGPVLSAAQFTRIFDAVAAQIK